MHRGHNKNRPKPTQENKNSCHFSRLSLSLQREGTPTSGRPAAAAPGLPAPRGVGPPASAAAENGPDLTLGEASALPGCKAEKSQRGHNAPPPPRTSPTRCRALGGPAAAPLRPDAPPPRPPGRPGSEPQRTAEGVCGAHRPRPPPLCPAGQWVACLTK